MFSLSTFWLTFWATLLATVLALLIGYIARCLWLRRREPWPWVRATRVARSKRAEQSNREELVANVLQRSTVLRKLVPLRVSGSNPTEIVWHPSGERSYYVTDFAAYRHQMENQLTPPLRSFHKQSVPAPVERWSDADLRAWLEQHRDDVPPE